MPSAAGIIMATGAMTLANEFLQAQAPADPHAPGNVAARVNFKVIPATAIAAGLFYLFEQAAGPVATGLAWIVFVTAFAFPAESWYQHPTNTPHLSPLGTLMKMTGISNPQVWVDSGIPIS